MSDDTPHVVDLRKQDEENEEDPGRNPENELDTEAEGDVYENAREEYPEGVESNDEAGDPDEDRKDPSGQSREEYTEEMEEPAENEGEGEAKQKGDKDDEEEKAFSLRAFNITAKFDEEKAVNDLKEGSLVLLDTPLEGAKVGEVVGKEESWTGTLNVQVDTGANKYELTPYDDEFGEQFIACIGEEGEVTQEVLQHLGKTTIDKLDVGNQVMLDVPKMGPVRGTVAHKAQTETQGQKIDVNTGPATFTIYEEPSPAQRKEQPMIVGQVQ